MHALQLLLLGSLDLRSDGRQLPRPPTTKSQSLLAYLVLHRQQPQPRERLAALFWSDWPERRARRSLTTALWHVRRCLPCGDWILSDVHTVQFDPRANLWLDVAEFESLVARPDLAALQAAVALYRGDFMEGFYDDWVLSARYRLETLYAEALARLMVGLEAAGEPQNALAVGMRLLQHDPLREDAHRLVMRTCCRLGRRNAALEQYGRCREIVARELNAEPMQETTEQYRAILEGRFGTGPAAEAAAAASTAIEPVRPQGYNPLDPTADALLVGRDGELGFLLDRFQEARAGRGGLVLIAGEAGVGKTRLVEEFADQLRWQGVRVLWGRCYEFERLLPYQPFGEALQAVLAGVPPGDLAEIPSWVLAELARLAPALAEKLPGLGTGGPEPLDHEQTHLFEGVARFMAHLSAGSALVLILDDLHWATHSTLEMIHYLARSLAQGRALMVATLRPEAVDPQHPLASFRRQLQREELVLSLDLANLPPAAVEALVSSMAGGGPLAAPLAQRLYTETEGNPFFLTEMVKALFDAGLVTLQDGVWHGDIGRLGKVQFPLPVGLSEAIQARVDRLDEDAREALCVAAVLGREFDFDLLNTAWKHDEEATLKVLDILLRRRLIREGSGALGRDYAFRHHQIREVIYAGIPSRRRRHLHARAGLAMEALNAADLEAVAGELAFHLGQGAQQDSTLVERTIRYLLLAGDRARLAYAHRETIDYYSRALAMQQARGDPEQAGRTLIKLGLAYHTGFDFARAHGAFEEGFARWQQAGRHELRTSRQAAPHPLRVRWRSPYSLDPALSHDFVSALVIDQLFRGLVSAGPELDIVPEVARRWQVLDEGRRYRFHLRRDARWSDGAPLTARDFEFAWKRALDPASGSSASGLLAIAGGRAYHEGESADGERVGVRALDDWTLDVELQEPVSHFLYELASVQTRPVPQHVVAAHGPAWTSVDTIVTNGPFKLEAWNQGACMRLARNPFYAGQVRGNVEQVVLHFPQDLSPPLEAYARGELDILTLTDAAVQDGDRIRRQFAAEYVSAPWLFTIYLAFVAGRPPCDDARLRQALALAADRDELANVVLRGMYTPGAGGVVPPGMPGHSPGIGFPYNPDRARRLLAAAGYAGGAGLPTLQALTVPPIDPLITQFLQAQWEANLGVRVAWEVADWPPFSRRMELDPPHLYVLARFADCPDPADFATLGAEKAWIRWQHPEYEGLLDQARRVLDQEARLALLQGADRIMIQEAAVVPLFYGRQHLLVKPWVSSFPISALNRWYWQDTIIKPH